MSENIEQQGSASSYVRRSDGSRQDPTRSRHGSQGQRPVIIPDEAINSREGKDKKGTSGRELTLLANYFNVRRSDAWNLFQYRVDFEPEIERVGLKRWLLKQYAVRLPAYVFDGGSLFCTEIIHETYLEMSTVNPRDQLTYNTKLRFVGNVERFDPMYSQFYNIMTRKCLELVGLVVMGRNHFDSDPHASIRLPQHNLEIWPGFLTTMRHHDKGLLYCVQSLHKVIRRDTVWDYLQEKRQEITGRGGTMDRVKEAVRAELIGTTVITKYNNKTYRIDDIAWTERATSTFEQKGSQVSFVDYYLQKYQITIRFPNQPLLISNPKKSDIRRGQKEPCRLVPELCNLTGLTEVMRQNFGLMRDMGQFLFQGPQKKADTIEAFVNRIRRSPEVKLELQKWDLEIGKLMIEIPGRQLPPQTVVFKDGNNQLHSFQANHQADFTQAFRSMKLTACVSLKMWVCIVSGRDSANLDNLFSNLLNVAKNMGFFIEWPTEIVRLQTPNVDAYVEAVNKAAQKYQRGLQMIMTVLPNNRAEVYAAIKKRCYVEYGIPSQCFLAKNLNSKGLMSIATKLAVQMNCKLGGEAWQIKIPVKKLMIVGFDVYHCGPGSQGASIGAMVANLTDTHGKYYSTVTMKKSREEITANMGSQLLKCVEAYRKYNNELPERIMFYRDGVGDGQLYFVYSEELEGIKALLKKAYEEQGIRMPLLTFIVVTKRINARIFRTNANRSEVANPEPGTIVDDAITLPERFDFYLVAQNVRQGTVSPTSYNVIWDRSGLAADRIQYLTYKLCHLYFNWSGTVAVPAPCQYAHKLAYLTGMATKAKCNSRLSNFLYFL